MLDAEDKKFIEDAANGGHEELITRAVARAVEGVRAEMAPFLKLVAEHEQTLNGTQKNPHGLVEEHNDIKSKITKLWILLPLLPPATIAVWEVAKALFKIYLK